MGKRLRAQRRGKGSVWQSPSHRHAGAIRYPQVRELSGRVVDLIHERGHRGNLRVIVGGAPLSQAFADEIGADGYSYDAAGAVELVKTLVGAA